MKRSMFSRRRFMRQAAVAAASAGVAGAFAADGAAAASSAAEQSASRSDADLALINGKIVTLDAGNTVVSTLAIRNGRIASVGQPARAARTIDLKGATVIPGLIDVHNHMYWTKLHPGPEVRDVELAHSVPELLRTLSQRARAVPATQFLCCSGGWTRRSLKERRLPTLAELDAAVPDHVVWLADTEASAGDALTNSRGMAFFAHQGLAGDARTGAIPCEQSSKILLSQHTDEERLDGAIGFALAHGLTMTHEFVSWSSDKPVASLEEEFPYLIDLWRMQKLRLRLRLRLYATDAVRLEARMVNNINRLGDDVLRLNGFGEAISEQDDEQLVTAARLVARYGWSAHVHSLEPAANQAQLAAFRAANAVHPIRNLRWSLAHVPSATPEFIAALKELGAGVTADGYYARTDLLPTDVPTAHPSTTPWRMMLDSGIPLGAGSDGIGTASMNPWMTLYAMITGRNDRGELINPGQTLSRLEALKVHTQGSAWHSFDEHHLGSLEVGKLADLAVLSDDVLTVKEEDLRRIKSTRTFQAGTVVHET